MINLCDLIGSLHNLVTWYKITHAGTPGGSCTSGLSKPKAGQGGLILVALFWKSYSATMRPNMCDFVPCDRRSKRVKCPQENYKWYDNNNNNNA